MNEIYQEYFDMMDYSPEELEKELPRIEKGFKKLGVTEEDLKICIKRIKDTVDLELSGIRMILKLYFTETINLLLAGEEYEKIIYVTLPGWGGAFVTPLRNATDKIYGQVIDLVTAVALHSLFNKQITYLEAGEKYLPAGNMHCAGYRTLLGALDLEILAKPDLMITWGNYCDEGPKVTEYISEKYDIPIIFIDMYQDYASDVNNPTSKHVKFLAEEMRRTFDVLQEIFGITVTDEMLTNTMTEVMGPFNDLMAIQKLMLENDPVPLSVVDFMFAFTCQTVTTGTPDAKKLKSNALKTLRKELRVRAKKGIGPVEKGQPRILEAAPSFSDPEANHLFQEYGLQIVGSDLTLFPPDAQPLPDISGCNNFYEYVSTILSSMPIATGFAVRKMIMSKVIQRYNIDGVILDPSYSCRPAFTEAHVMKDFLQKELKIPVMILEHDVYDPRFFTPGQVRTRIETFSEQVRVHRAMKELEQ